MTEEMSFPVIEDPAGVQWHWPVPPFSWRHAATDNEVAQPCRIETRFGTTVDGELLRIDPEAGTLVFRTDPAGTAVTLAFARMSRLTLVTPLKPSPRFAGAPPERVPAAAQERDYTLQMERGEPLAGRTAGYVERPEGLYLFTPEDDERSLVRSFVPRSAYTGCEFGRSAEEIAAERWCATPEQLLAAVERQRQAPVFPIGQAMLQLGLLTPRQLGRALAEKPADLPLGEMLVAQGVISSADLQTAIAHKMGYPLVDLTRFPVDFAAARRLPLRQALENRALPLMTTGEQLFVAVDRPARTARLRTLSTLARSDLVPVLASRNHIMIALQALAQDIWAESAGGRPAFFASTT